MQKKTKEKNRKKSEDKEMYKLVKKAQFLKVNYKIYLLGFTISGLILVFLFIMLFQYFYKDTIWPTFFSCMISVVGGIVVSFIATFLIDLSNTKRENSAIISKLNNEADAIVLYTNTLFELIEKEYFENEDLEIYEMCANFPFSEFDLKDDVCLSIFVFLSLISASVDQIININNQYSTNDILNIDSSSFNSFREGLLKFKECCIIKSVSQSDGIGTLISELGCIVFFSRKIKYFDPKRNKKIIE